MNKKIIIIALAIVIAGIAAITYLQHSGAEGIILPGENSTYTPGIHYVNGEEIPVLEEGFGVYGSEVVFENVYPGWEGTVPMIIVNGNDRDRLFTISITSPVRPKDGYEALPTEYFYWITISEPEVTIEAGDTREIPITLEMPEGVDYSGKKAEVRIRISDMTQTGLVQIALEAKWFIITARYW